MIKKLKKMLEIFYYENLGIINFGVHLKENFARIFFNCVFSIF